jgi:hypothetical protein
MLTTSVYLTQEQLALLKAINVRTKVPMAEYIRRAIDAWIEGAVERGELRPEEAAAALDGLDKTDDARERSLEGIVERAVRRLLPPEAKQ